MKSLFILGMPRGGTTVTMDLFCNVPGVTIMSETPRIDVWEAIHRGDCVVWKSPHDCLRGELLKMMFPDVPQAHVIRDGRQNLAAHKHYVETYGIDPSFAPFQGPMGFAKLWNKFATEVLKTPIWFRLEDLTSDAGELILRRQFEENGFQGIDDCLGFWRQFVYRQDIQCPDAYPRQATSLSTPHWSEVLTTREINSIDQGLLNTLGYN